MNKNICYILGFVFTLYSCDNFKGIKKENRNEILKEKWSEIDTNQVEQPPLFSSCMDQSDELLETCFQQTIINHITSQLAEHIISVKDPINDTIWVPLLITKNREIILEDFSVPDIITSQIPDFKSIIRKSIDNLPKVEPAHTRSTDVTTRYKLPLVILMD
ncbi:hypothetical protein [Aquimarina addita]